VNNKVLTVGGLRAQSGCTTSSSSATKAYLCDTYMPTPVAEDLSYGFAAMSNTTQCCKCFKLLWTNGYAAGKSMIVQTINAGSDLNEGDMAILTPGGGIGKSNEAGCKAQYGTTW
jgi:Glycosyl hydrolase family 45